VFWVHQQIDRIDKDDNKVLLKNGNFMHYDILIIATGTHIAPSEIQGMLGEEWHKSIFDFYTFEGAKILGIN
jgi:sulfide:quinone oxidoreductase